MRPRGPALRRLHWRLCSLLGLDASMRRLMTSLFRVAARVPRTVRLARRVLHTRVPLGVDRHLRLDIARNLEAGVERRVARRLRRPRGSHANLALAATGFACSRLIACRFLAALVRVPARARGLTHRFLSGTGCLAAFTERRLTSLELGLTAVGRFATFPLLVLALTERSGQRVVRRADTQHHCRIGRCFRTTAEQHGRCERQASSRAQKPGRVLRFHDSPRWLSAPSRGRNHKCSVPPAHRAMSRPSAPR